MMNYCMAWWRWWGHTRVCLWGRVPSVPRLWARVLRGWPVPWLGWWLWGRVSGLRGRVTLLVGGWRHHHHVRLLLFGVGTLLMDCGTGGKCQYYGEYWTCYNELYCMCNRYSVGLILGLRPANERPRCFITKSLIGWAQARPANLSLKASKNT